MTQPHQLHDLELLLTKKPEEVIAHPYKVTSLGRGKYGFTCHLCPNKARHTDGTWGPTGEMGFEFRRTSLVTAQRWAGQHFKATHQRCGIKFGECAEAYSAPHECEEEGTHKDHRCGCGLTKIESDEFVAWIATMEESDECS